MNKRRIKKLELKAFKYQIKIAEFKKEHLDQKKRELQEIEYALDNLLIKYPNINDRETRDIIMSSLKNKAARLKTEINIMENQPVNNTPWTYNPQYEKDMQVYEQLWKLN